METSIEKIIAEVLDIPETSVNSKLRLQSIPQWDSFNHIDLMLSLEEAFAVEIDIRQIAKLTSVSKIRDFINLHSPNLRSKNENTEFDKEHDGEQALVSNGKQFNGIHPSGTKPEFLRGLNGIVLDKTKISFINGQSGKLQYRGYPISDLIAKSSYEEISYLLLYGDLPSQTEYEHFDILLRNSRPIPQFLREILFQMRSMDPTMVLQTSVSILGSANSDGFDSSTGSVTQQGIRLIAQIPTIVATHHSITNNRDPLLPDKSLSHAENFLYMLTGKKPSIAVSQIIDKDFILHADHGANASTLAARVATSAQADLFSAITAAISTFSGSVHGGAVEGVSKMLNDIGKPSNASKYIANLRSKKMPIMGFGHRVYEVEDPRVDFLRRTVRKLCEESGNSDLNSLLETVVNEMQPYSSRGINVNVDFYSGALYSLLNIPSSLSLPIFVIGRVSGWIAHILEQLNNNVIIRPVLNYVSEVDRTYIPIKARTVQK